MAATSLARGCIGLREEGWPLMGPAPASPRRPGVDRLPVEAFTVDIAHQRAYCPAGHESRRCSRICENCKAKISYRFKWRKSDCQCCPLREHCVPAYQPYRTLIVGSAPRAFATTPDRTTHRGL